MVYSPAVVLIRDDNGNWRSPVEVDVLTSAAVNAGEIRRGLEMEERLRKERVEMEERKKRGTEVDYWKKKGEERRKEIAKERQRLREEMAKKNEADTKGKVKDSNQEPTSSSTIVHPLSHPTQPSQALDSDPNLTYAFALENAEIQIQQTMYARISRILHLFQLHQTPHLILGPFGTGVLENKVDLIATIFADLLIKPGGRFKDVFQTVVFAILEKETAREFTEVFRTVDKRAQSERAGKTCVFEGWYGSDEDVKKGNGREDVKKGGGREDGGQ